MYRIDCILVTYKPDLDKLELLLKNISQQVRTCYVVNNDINKIFCKIENVVTIELGCNHGIAFAQNRGIEQAMSNDADFVILSDQDTVFPDDYVSEMLKKCLLLDIEKLACLGPVFFNTVRQCIERVSITKFRAVSPITYKDNLIKVEHVIASGAMIPCQSLKKIGLMNADLFIDFVDFEWCWRAAQSGLITYINKDIIIRHALGDKAKTIFFKTYTLRSSTRYYYMLRNGLYLTFGGVHMKLHERLLYFIKMMKMSIGILILNSNRIKNLLVINKACIDALLRNLGRKK